MMNSTEVAGPCGSPLTEGLGPVVTERAVFEAAAEAIGLRTHRDPEWHALGAQTESARPYYNGRTDSAWWAWQASATAERERCPAPRWWHCDTHGPGTHTAWGCPECVREMRVSLSRARGLLIEIDSVLRMAESRGGGQLTAAAVRAAVEPYLPLDAGPNVANEAGQTARAELTSKP